MPNKVKRRVRFFSNLRAAVKKPVSWGAAPLAIILLGRFFAKNAAHLSSRKWAKAVADVPLGGENGRGKRAKLSRRAGVLRADDRAEKTPFNSAKAGKMGCRGRQPSSGLSRI